MIVIEGPDGAGKTSLGLYLVSMGIVGKVLPSPRIPAKGNVDRMKYEIRRYLHLYDRNNHVAVDRFLFSEMVYGPVLRGKSSLTRAEYLSGLLELSLSGSIVIFCDPITLHPKPDENPVVIENLERIRELYRHCAEDSAFCNPKTYIYRWDEPDSSQGLLSFIKEKQ